MPAKYMKKSTGSIIFDGFNYLFISFLTFLFIYPMWYVFATSISRLENLAYEKVTLLPLGFELTAYKTVLSDPSILLAYYNTILYSVSGTVLVLILTAVTAYPLSLKRFYGKGLITVFIAIPMFIGGGLIPFFLLLRSLGMINTIWAIIVPGALSTWNIIIFRTNFKTIPESLIESAYIDGARNLRILFQIVLPLSKPILATIGLFSIVGQWNNFFGPLLFLDSNSKMPLQVILRKLIVEQSMRGQFIEALAGRMDTEMYRGLTKSLKMAAVIVSIGPIILAYPFVQKYFIKGVLIGSIKG